MEKTDPLPVFRYHPDPLKTGSVVVAADAPCLGCSRIRGYIYTGPVFTSRNFPLEHHLCPWCIADGSAAREFAATFNDTGETDGIGDAARKEVETRTPGFTAWQQERWLSCCGDAAAFLGAAGAEELMRDHPAAVAEVKKHLREEYELSMADAEEFFGDLRKDDEPTAYVFGCLDSDLDLLVRSPPTRTGACWITLRWEKNLPVSLRRAMVDLHKPDRTHTCP
jgi:uncharacterized protein